MVSIINHYTTSIENDSVSFHITIAHSISKLWILCILFLMILAIIDYRVEGVDHNGEDHQLPVIRADPVLSVEDEDQHQQDGCRILPYLPQLLVLLIQRVIARGHHKSQTQQCYPARDKRGPAICVHERMRGHRVLVSKLHTNQVQKGADHDAVAHTPVQELRNMTLVSTSPVILTAVS